MHRWRPSLRSPCHPVARPRLDFPLGGCQVAAAPSFAGYIQLDEPGDYFGAGSSWTGYYSSPVLPAAGETFSITGAFANDGLVKVPKVRRRPG
jgi:hypothetical protein